MKTTYYFIVSLVLCIVNLHGQQISTTSNFMFNQQIYNPAAFGSSSSKVNFSTLIRLQWTSIEGAPVYAHFWGDYKFKNMAMGLNLGTYSYSGYSINDVNLNYVYQLSLTKRIKLASAVRAGFTNSQFNTDEFSIWDQDDQVIANSHFNTTRGKVGAGFHFSTRKSYLGFSSGDFFTFNNKISLDGDTSKGFLSQKRNLNAFIGTKIKLSDEYNIRPHAAFYYYKGTGAILQVNSTFEIKDYFWIGLGYSSYNSASLNLGTHISSRLRFAYAFETSSNNGARLNSHEINILLTMDNLFRKKKD